MAIQSQSSSGIEQPTRSSQQIGANAEKVIRDLFAEVDVVINGPNPADIQVKDRRFYQRVLAEGVLGFGESFMDDW